jgi:chromosome segregation protein
MNAAVYEADTAGEQLREAQDELIRLEGESNHLSHLLDAAREAIEGLRGARDAVGARVSLNGDETKAVQADITALEESAAGIKAQIEDAMRGQELLQQERERVNAALSELRAEMASLDAERDALAKAVSEFAELREKLSGDREKKIETLDGLKTENDEIRARILDKQRAAVAAESEIERHKQRLGEVNDKKLRYEAERSGMGKALQEKNNEQLVLERECSRLEQRKHLAESEEKHIIDKLLETYELSVTSAKIAGAPIESAEKAARRVSALKREIAELGTPNIGAIDEYERVNTRYAYLTSQRDDVDKGRVELLGLIDEITNHMREIFIDQFNIINESFGTTFKDLFGGGRASLELEDPNDALECGIEINVQPPGKSLKTLTLLSGGEKAFVAIAIYFAILNVRPPPFVVLDEIDAALDESNVLRFASYMRRMSDNTQMIVISHKRSTMEDADVLYGVTMQELGVSSILRVDLEEAERHFAGANRK